MSFPLSSALLKNVRLALALGLAGASAAAYSESAAEPTTGYAAIQRAFIQERFEQATSLAQSFILQNPDAAETPRVWLWLALSLDRLQRSNEALREIDRLKNRLNSQDLLWPEVLYWEGTVSRTALQMLRAKLAYQQLLERFPESMWSAQAQLGLGLIDVHQQSFLSAIEHFRAVSSKEPGSTAARDALLFEGLCRLQLKQFREAVSIFESLLAQWSDPSLITQASFSLGEALSGMSRYEKAIAAYRRSLEASPSSQWQRPAQFGLAWALAQSNRCGESADLFEEYLADKTAQHRSEALVAQGRCFLRLGRGQEATKNFEQILSRSPDHPLAMESGFILVDLYRRQEQLDRAKELLHRLLQHHPPPLERAQVQLKLGAIALEQGNAAQANTIFTLVLRLDRFDESSSALVPSGTIDQVNPVEALAKDSKEEAIRQSALNGLGDVKLFLGEAPSAREFYEASIERSSAGPAAEYAWYQIGRIRLQEGDIDEAVRIFQQLIARADAGIADEARLALLLAHLSQKEEALARSLLEQIRSADAESPLAARAGYYEALLALGADKAATARDLCERSIAKAPHTDEALEARLLLADLQAEEKSIREAKQWLERIYLTEALPRGHRARLAKRLGDFARASEVYAEALRWYEKASALLPSLGGEARYRMASCYEEAGDLEVALRQYQQVPRGSWRARGQLAAAKILERQGRLMQARVIYERLAQEPVPEAKVVQDRLVALRGQE